jgi:hypothetical protein
MGITIVKSQTNAIVVDPTVLNTRERLKVFLESMIFKSYTSFLPSAIGSLIKKEKWNELIALLRQWEWTLDRRKSEEWFGSTEFKVLSKRLLEVCISFENIKQELSPKERKMLSVVHAILGSESPIIVDLAKELVETALTKHASILSYSRHLKRWLKSLRRVIILEISEKTDALAQAKKDIKAKLHNAGWKGSIYVSLLNITTGLVLTGTLPSTLSPYIASILTDIGEDIVVIILMNGK